MFHATTCYPIGLRLGVVCLALAVAGCTSTSLDMFSSKPAADSPSQASAIGPSDEDVECPSIVIRAGAATLSVVGKAAGAADAGALDLRYQGNIVKTARECHVVAGNLTMKVGIEGRVVLGPAGGPGQLEVPMRLAVVQEGSAPKTILSKLARIPVVIPPDADRVTFTHVDSEILFPLPRPLGLIDSYVVYIGFDANALAPEKPKAAPRRKR